MSKAAVIIALAVVACGLAAGLGLAKLADSAFGTEAERAAYRAAYSPYQAECARFHYSEVQCRRMYRAGVATGDFMLTTEAPK